MENKEHIINSMITLLNFFKDLPIIVAEYDIIADNTNIEIYLQEHVETIDWFDNPLDEDTVKELQKKSLEIFHNSEGYNKDGKSKMTFRTTLTLQKITFDNIREIIEGKSCELPNNYEFVGDFRLANI